MLMENGMFLERNDELYEVLVPSNHLLRQIDEIVDFTFIYDELKNKYCLNNGRIAINPIVLFKYIILKHLYKLSDVDVVKRSLYDLSFKYFLGMDPRETQLINPSSLTKFRRNRLKDENLLDILITKSIEIALNNGLQLGGRLILDSTHTTSSYNVKSPHQALMGMAKDIRRNIYAVDEALKELLPKKPQESDGLDTIIAYCEKLCKLIKSNDKLKKINSIKESTNYLSEIIEDASLEKLELSKEAEAAVGHKSKDSNFYGFKNHLGINEDGIVVAATVTTGEKHDGKELQALLEKAKSNGMEVETIIGDGAYSEQDNLKIGKENNVAIVSNLSSMVVNGYHKNEFEYNKDAGMYVCSEGHMAINKASRKRTVVNGVEYGKTTTYFFDVEKCKRCKLKEGCYKEGARTKTYSVSEKSSAHQEQLEFMETDFFKQEMKHRYKVEQLNAHLKKDLGLGVTVNLGLSGLNIQTSTVLFISNIQKILRMK